LDSRPSTRGTAYHPHGGFTENSLWPDNGYKQRAMSPTLRLSRTTWRWYWVLLLTNAMDLLFTYTAVERGFEEWNPLLRPFLLTAWPVALKGTAFLVLGYGLWQLMQRPRSARRISVMIQSTAMMYLAVIAIHLVGLFLLRAV